MSGLPLRRNLAVLLLLAGGIAIVDQHTKTWADQALATTRHPLPVAGDGKTPVETLVTAQLGVQPAEAARLVRKGKVLVFSGEPVKDAETLAFPPGRRDAYRTLYVFLRGRGEAPRRVPLYQRGLLLQWMRLLGPDAIKGEAREAADALYAKATLLDQVDAAITHADRVELADVFAKGLVYASSSARPAEPGKAVASDSPAVLSERIIVLVDDYLRLVYAENPGAAWSFLADAPAHVRLWFFGVISALAAIFLIALSVRQPGARWLPLISYSSICGGAIGNLIDRVNTNFVIDFIDMYWGTHHWPTYNVADMGISVGVTLLILDHIFGPAPDADDVASVAEQAEAA